MFFYFSFRFKYTILFQVYKFTENLQFADFKNVNVRLSVSVSAKVSASNQLVIIIYRKIGMFINSPCARTHT